jgi:uncharacterized coiled-coil protein SlyX
VELRMSDEIKEIIRKVTLEVMQSFDSRIKVLTAHAAEQDASIFALVTLLDEKNSITTDEFDARKDEIMKKIKDGYKDLVNDFKKHKMEDGVQ